MPVDRLFAIVTLLLRHGQMTTPQLAERLEVSRRTITRDVDALCRAGVPVVTRQGSGGGISIAEGYVIDRGMLSNEELQGVLTGLKGLASVNAAPQARAALRKLAPNPKERQDIIQVDLASFYQDSLSHKITLLRQAIEKSRLAAFTYYSPKGNTQRQVEPHLVFYRWQSWYLLCFCRTRQDFTTFKLNRLWDVTLLPETFSPRPLPPQTLDFDSYFKDNHTFTLQVAPQAEYLLVESYGPGSYTRLDDSTLLYTGSYTSEAHIINWILSFGPHAAVLEPPALRKALQCRLRETLNRYEERT